MAYNGTMDCVWLNLRCYQSDEFNEMILVKDSAGNTVDLTGALVSFYGRLTNSATINLFELTVANGGVLLTNPTAGVCQLKASPATMGFNSLVYAYDDVLMSIPYWLQITPLGANKQTFASGPLTIFRS